MNANVVYSIMELALVAFIFSKFITEYFCLYLFIFYLFIYFYFLFLCFIVYFFILFFFCFVPFYFYLIFIFNLKYNTAAPCASKTDTNIQMDSIVHVWR